MHPLSLLPALLPLTSVLLSTLLHAPHPVWAGSQKVGQNCSTGDSKLLEGTYAFYDDCDAHAYCNETTSQCQNKECRHDIFPFGYIVGEHMPPLCEHGTFCPDEQSFCLEQQPVGSPCQLNRDDQCQPPENFADLTDHTGRGLNTNGSVCLNNVCMWANVTAGQECVVENTAYIAYEADGSEYIDIVSRGNCQPNLYCDSGSRKCMATKNAGDACDADKECASYNCNVAGVCGADPHLPVHVATWVFAVVAICIVGGMGGTLFGLYVVHRRERDAERERRVQYWREQHALRQNILQMQESARESVIGAQSARSSSYLDENSPFAGVGAKSGSGLRHEAYSEDGASDDGQITYDESRNRF